MCPKHPSCFLRWESQQEGQHWQYQHTVCQKYTKSNPFDSGSSPKRSHYNFGICCNNSAPYMQLYHQINTTGCPSVYNVQKEHTIGVPLSPTQMPLCPTGMPLSPTGLSGHAAPSGGLHHYATPVMHCCRAATGRQPLRGTMSRRSRLLGCP
jgi:hypothetical protein